MAHLGRNTQGCVTQGFGKDELEDDNRVRSVRAEFHAEDFLASSSDEAEDSIASSSDEEHSTECGGDDMWASWEADK